MPIAVPKATMLPVEEILRTALAEHDFQNGPAVNPAEAHARALTALDSPGTIPYYVPGSTAPLTVCRFRCMLQDTGYPLEVYMPPLDSPQNTTSPAADDLYGNAVDWSRLKERWVGWGVEIPGEQLWIKNEIEGASGIENTLANLALNEHASTATSSTSLPPSVHGKFPDRSVQGNYAGVLLKVYDAESSYQAASAFTFTGIVSSSSLPASDEDEEEEEGGETSALVPTIHVLTPPYESYPLRAASVSTPNDASREEVIAHLSGAFTEGDRLSAEFLLLALLSSVTTRIPGGAPLGTLSLNLLVPKDSDAGRQSFQRIVDTVSSVTPLVTPVELTIDLLSKGSFFPYSVNAASSTGLQSGVLQLVSSTMVIMNEDTLEGGDLKDRAVNNLKATMAVFKNQKLRYEFPFVGEEFGMDVDLGLIVVGQGKSFLPVDLHLPILPGKSSERSSSIDENKLKAIRRYIAESRAAAKSLQIPDDAAEHIQTEFVRLRKEATAEGKTVGEEELRRWMKIARLLALSYPSRTITKEIWANVLAMDSEREVRLESR